MYNALVQILRRLIVFSAESDWFLYLGISCIIIYLAGEWYFSRKLIGSSISEFSALFTFKQNKMASSFGSVTEEEN